MHFVTFFPNSYRGSIPINNLDRKVYFGRCTYSPVHVCLRTAYGVVLTWLILSTLKKIDTWIENLDNYETCHISNCWQQIKDIHCQIIRKTQRDIIAKALSNCVIRSLGLGNRSPDCSNSFFPIVTRSFHFLFVCLWFFVSLENFSLIAVEGLQILT